MNLADLSVRIKRLEQLSLNLSREELRVMKGALRLHFDERREYLQAIREAIAGVEKARVVLALADHRMEGDAAPGG
jgi:hypothetical protein